VFVVNASLTMKNHGLKKFSIRWVFKVITFDQVDQN